MFKYFAIYKPFGYLSQFTKEAPDHQTLKDIQEFPPDVYPVGRLDKDSEGLLILTNDKKLNHHLLNPKFQHARTYLAQVEGIPDKTAIQLLSKGVSIKVNKKQYQTLPAKIELLEQPPELPERDPPIRFRKNIPTSWLKITLTEGKNRQVRKMCAKVGFPVLRLVRIAIEHLQLDSPTPGQVVVLEQSILFELLGTNKK